MTSILSQLASLLRGTAVRDGLGVNDFKQMDLNIKSNMPPFVQALSQSVTNSVCARA